MARMRISLARLENLTDWLLRKAATIWYKSVQSWSFFIAGFTFTALLWTGIILDVREFQNGNMSEIIYFQVFAYLAMIPGAFICASWITIASYTILSLLSAIAECVCFWRRDSDGSNLLLNSILLPWRVLGHVNYWFSRHERIYTELSHLSSLHKSSN